MQNRDAPNLTDKLDASVTKLFEQAKVDNLICITANCYNDKLFEKLFKPFLKDNIPKIISYFKLSSSFDNAVSYAHLLDELADFISLAQWKEILEVFFQNDQIYNSRGCASKFESLFKKSLELDASIKPYWSSFREKLNSFGIHNRYLNSLKDVIDSKLAID